MPNAVSSARPAQLRPAERLALAPREAAQMLGISRASLYREIQAGRLRKRKTGARTLIAVEDARAWLDARH